MIIIAVCIATLFAYSSKVQVSGSQMHYVYPVIPQRIMIPEYTQMSKRFSKAEPSCEELRIMWKYSKRQSRAIESTNELPMFRDPFLYNVWEAYPSRTPLPTATRETHGHSRSAGNVPIYGKMVHKEPEGRTLRNGMPTRLRILENASRLYGTINRKPPASRKRLTSFRIGNGVSLLPQTGSFQHLKDLIISERAQQIQRPDQYGKVLYAVLN